MMEFAFIQIVFLVLLILALVMVANKIKIAYPIILVVGGLLLSFIPMLRTVRIQPEWVFFIFLPPLLYEASWQVSWKEFWKFRRVIGSFAFPVVIITACVIAFASVALIPGFTLALGFLLGAIISPPDAIAATTIMRQVRVPKSLLSVAEGESLLNDASSLIVFRFALAAILTGQFLLQEAMVSFVLVVVMGIVIGLAVGVVFYAIHRWLPTTPSIEIVLTLVTPYCMYYAAEHFHFSGVLAVVAGGLFLSNRRLRILNYETRMQAVNVWSSIVFVLNGFIFLLIGLQQPAIIRGLGDINLSTAIGYGLIITLVLIVSRLLFALFASWFSTFMSRFITVADAHPGWKGPVILGWAGMRGVVSLAAALSLPLLLMDGSPFPFRNLILFITFIVILITLVFQGLTLPWLIRKLKLEGQREEIPERDQERMIQRKLAKASLDYLHEQPGLQSSDNKLLVNLRDRLNMELTAFTVELEESENANSSGYRDFLQTYLGMLDHQRHYLDYINNNAACDEDLIRKYQALIDIEEFKVRSKLQPAGKV